jgi:hypothetical protein
MNHARTNITADLSTRACEASPLEGEAIDMDKLVKVSCTIHNTVPNNFL